MKKFLSIIGLTGIMLFAGNAAYAVEEVPETKPVVGVLPTATGQIIPLNSFDRDPVTGELDYRDTRPKFEVYPSTPAPAVAEAPAAVTPEPAAVTPEPAVAPMASTANSVPVVPLGVATEVPVTECGDITESGVIVGDNAEGCDCPRGPSGECYSEAVPNPGYVEPVPETVEPSVAPVETTALATEPVRTELAYTGAEDFLLATVGAAVTLAGVGLVRHSLRMRRKSAGYSV